MFNNSTKYSVTPTVWTPFGMRKLSGQICSHILGGSYNISRELGVCDIWNCPPIEVSTFPSYPQGWVPLYYLHQLQH